MPQARFYNMGNQGQVQKRKGTPRFEFIFGVVLIFLLCLILLNSKLFAVRNVEVKGNSKVSSEDIILNAGLNSYHNIFIIDNDELESLILQDFRIASVKIKRQLPDTIIISIRERTPICLLSYLHNLLIIGEDGLVMSAQEEAEVVELPVVTGVMLNNIKYGEKVKSSDFQIALEILKYSDDYLHQVISEIDLGRFQLKLDLPGYRHLIKVELGTAEHLENKVTNLRSILLSTDLKGKLEQIDLRISDLPTVITSKSLKK